MRLEFFGQLGMTTLLDFSPGNHKRLMFLWGSPIFLDCELKGIKNVACVKRCDKICYIYAQAAATNGDTLSFQELGNYQEQRGDKVTFLIDWKSKDYVLSFTHFIGSKIFPNYVQDHGTSSLAKVYRSLPSFKTLS